MVIGPMSRAGVVLLVIYVSLAFLGPEAEGQRRVPPMPLCASQFALVNHACSFLPYFPIPPPAPPAPAVPPGPPSPPEPPAPEDPQSSGHSHHHSHSRHPPPARHHHHHHHHHHHYDPTPVEASCCRWLKEVDSVCVCDLLVHLPTFLSKPGHDYTVMVGQACNITYSCPGRLRP